MTRWFVPAGFFVSQDRVDLTDRDDLEAASDGARAKLLAL